MMGEYSDIVTRTKRQLALRSLVRDPQVSSEEMLTCCEKLCHMSKQSQYLLEGLAVVVSSDYGTDETGALYIKHSFSE